MEEPGLLSFTNELLAKILSAAGSRGAAACAASCTRLHAAARQLSQQSCFGSALVLGSVDSSLEEDLAQTLQLAQDRMTAPAQFAVLFVVGPGARAAGGKAILHPASAVASKLLPAGCQLVGCTSRGLFGVTASGTAAELDPRPPKQHGFAGGVSVLLGRLPGCHVAAVSLGRTTKADALCEAVEQFVDAAYEPSALLLLASPNGLRATQEQLSLACRTLPAPLALIGGVGAGNNCLLWHGHELAAGQEGPTPPTAPQPPQRVALIISRPRTTAHAAGGAGTAGAAAGAIAAGAVQRGPTAAALAVEGHEGFGPVSVNPAFGVSMDAQDGEWCQKVLRFSSAPLAGQDGSDALPELRDFVYSSTEGCEVGLWLAPAAEAATQSYNAAQAAGLQVLKLQPLEEVEGSEALHVLAHGTAAARLQTEMAREEASAGQLMFCLQLLKFGSAGVLREMGTGLERLAAHQLPPDPLLPAANSGVVVVSCSAKGRQLHKEQGKEAGVLAASLPGVPLAGAFLDGEIGPEVLDGASAIMVAGAEERAQAALQGFTTMSLLLSG